MARAGVVMEKRRVGLDHDGHTVRVGPRAFQLRCAFQPTAPA
jgi:hypothetical protein